MTAPVFTKEDRPLASKSLCKQLTTWFALKCHPEKFDNELCRSILGKYCNKTRKQDIPSEDALSDKQYNILYNIYEKYRVNNIFKWADLKFVCVDMSELGIDLETTSGVKCEDFFFQTSDGTIYNVDEFIKEHNSLIKHSKYITTLRPLKDEDFD